jgi:hypothetical protein
VKAIRIDVMSRRRDPNFGRIPIARSPVSLGTLDTCMPRVVTVNIDKALRGGYAAHVFNATTKGEARKDTRELWKRSREE